MKQELSQTAEQKRLDENATKRTPLELWGPYLSERQWGTVREDYSSNGDAWNYFSHDHSRSRAYRWGEDGIAGISDYNQLLCFAVAFWNHKDPILKERLFGLTNTEGNHGEDVKELYYFLDNTPTHSYMRMLYKYPHEAFPYRKLAEENGRRGKDDPEYELLDTGVFNEGRYFDIFTEYAKLNSEDIFIRITVFNHGPETASITVLPTLWYRNYWSFEDSSSKARMWLESNEFGSFIHSQHPELGEYFFYPDQALEAILFTENETNLDRLYEIPNQYPFVKDAFHQVIIDGKTELLNGNVVGSKTSPVYRLELGSLEKKEFYLRLSKNRVAGPPLIDAPGIFDLRINEMGEFYQSLSPNVTDPELREISRQAISGLLWSKQFYYYDVNLWLTGDEATNRQHPERLQGRNKEWNFLNNKDIILMPDTWEYPWYASWDLAFHCIPMAFVDSGFAKHQMTLLLREWYMSPMGQIPAYEWNFSDVNPPVHAWACLNIFRIEKTVHGRADIDFLKRVFQKLIINFTWWVNRKDKDGNNLFEGGFLGLDNIGVINRNEIPPGFMLEQVDGTSWMAMFALNMMDIALEIAVYDPTFEDVATKFYEHFVHISSSLNEAHLWHEGDSFFYDVLIDENGAISPIKVRSVVGLSVLFGVSVIPGETFAKLKDFERRTAWFKNYRTKRNQYLPNEERKENQEILLSLVSKNKLEKLLRTMLDEQEFLAPGGIRGLSKFHMENPREYFFGDSRHFIRYDPAESTTGMFGGNSNWRGPIWLPINYLIIKSLKKYHQFYGDDFKMEYPTGSGQWLNLGDISNELIKRIATIFRKDASGTRPVHYDHSEFYNRPENKDLILFYEYFHGDTSRGVGASHQTGWTALIVELINGNYWQWE
jgi:hypothetical protein